MRHQAFRGRGIKPEGVFAAKRKAVGQAACMQLPKDDVLAQQPAPKDE